MVERILQLIFRGLNLVLVGMLVYLAVRLEDGLAAQVFLFVFAAVLLFIALFVKLDV